MRLFLFIFILCGFCARAQRDKVFMKNGEIKKGMVVSVVNDFIFFRASDTSLTQRMPKSEILLVEKYDGKILIFSKKIAEEQDSAAVGPGKFRRHSFGIQPLNVFVGRMTASYEYLNKTGTIGFLLPVSVTFDPVGTLYKESNDSSGTSAHTPGYNLIGGADVNFYLAKGDFEGFYFGPRIRYGVDMFLFNIEAYSIQTQFGYRIAEPDSRLVQHLSVGLGFVRILASPAGNNISPKQSYGWASINYRIGFNW
jgi:hypothetical protein